MVIKWTGKVRVTPSTQAKADLQGALEGLLASPTFARSQRLACLLSYLARHNEPTPPSEYQIGIEVFRRDPSVYSTGEDPVVRVQVGRLRRKLADYYATSGRYDLLRLSVPAGGYRLRCERRSLMPATHAPTVLFIRPFACLTSLGGAFARGLGEELSDQLFHAFERAAVSVRLSRRGASAENALVLEGSVRAEANRVRVSVRLLDPGGGRILWAGQFDRSAPLLIATEQDIAEAICGCVIECFVQRAS